MTFYQKTPRGTRGKKSKLNYLLLNCSIISALLLMAVAYLLQANFSISYGLRMKEAELCLKTLKIENERLTNEVAQLNSISNIYKLSDELKMVKVAQADYLAPARETFAER